MNTISGNRLYEWSDGTKTEFTNFSFDTIDEKVIHKDVYQSGKCVLFSDLLILSNQSASALVCGI
jgi:hypothetical protein